MQIMAMQFARRLPPQLIDQLNVLQSDPASWWHLLTDIRHDRVFIAVRNNYLSVYANGGSLLKIDLDSQKRLRCIIHEEYAVLRSGKERYLVLDSEAGRTADLVTTTQGLREHFDQVCKRISWRMGDERKGVCCIARQVPAVVDVEVAGDQAEEEGNNRLDLAAVDAHGALWFFEAKTLDNAELRADKVDPPVISQLARYRRWLAEKETEIVEAYRSVLNVYRRLNGTFFRRRFQAVPQISCLHPSPVLCIFGYNGIDEKHRLPPILGNLCSRYEGFEAVTRGNATGFTSSSLFHLKRTT
jgi:hypothetical protein